MATIGEDRFLAALARHNDGLAAACTAEALAQDLLFGALDTIGEGLAVWDAVPNLVHFNRRLPELFGLTALDLKSGISAKDFLRLLIDQGLLTIRAEEADAWIEAYIDASTKADRKQEVRLTDGTWLNFDWRRLPAGSNVRTGRGSLPKRPKPVRRPRFA